MTPSEIATDDAQFALFAAEIRAARKRWGAEAVRELVEHYDSLDAEQEVAEQQRANEEETDDDAYNDNRRDQAAWINSQNRNPL